MKLFLAIPLWIAIASIVAVPLSHAQPPAAVPPPPEKETNHPQVIEVNGNGNAKEAAKLWEIWLNPEEYEGRIIRLRGFIYEPENFEYFPDQNGYLFTLEPLIYGRNNSKHAHVGYSTFLSHEKLNFFCTTADGQRIRRLFKNHSGEHAIAADVELEVRKTNGIYFGMVTSFKLAKLPESKTEVLP
ncbi:MAG: hypothetical protein RIS70_2527 [Planctomycetota bacterium]|jgi:hypothetical protein